MTMNRSIPEPDVVASVEPLWVPSVALDPETYTDVYATTPAPNFPVRVAISDSLLAGHDTKAWSTLLAQGFVGDRESTIVDVVRNLPVRSAVFAAQYASRLVGSDRPTAAGLVGVTLSASGQAQVVATAGYAVIRFDRNGLSTRWDANRGHELEVLADDPARCFDSWHFEWLPGDTVVVCGRGLPSPPAGEATGLDALWTESLAGFQGRMRVAFAAEGRSRSATAIRVRLNPR